MWFGAAVGILATTVVLLQVFVPSTAGLADNGDYRRLLCHIHVAADVPAGHPDKYAELYLTYHNIPPTHCEFASTAVVPLWVAARVSRLLPGHHALDLRVLAVGYALLFGAAIGSFVAAVPGPAFVRVVSAVVAIVLLGDFAFTSYFASGYSEPLALISLIAVLGSCLWHWRSSAAGVWSLAAVTAAGLVLVTTKPQYSPLTAALVVAVVARPIRSCSAARVRGRWPGIAAGVVLATGGLLAFTHSPRDYARDNQYQVVFFSILPHSPTPAADLQDLGLSPQLARWSGTNGYEPINARSDPAFDRFYEKTRPTAIGRFYATHPGRAVALVNRGFRASADPRLDYLGKTTKTSKPAGETSVCRFCLASSAGRLLRPASPVLLPLLWFGALAVGVDRLRRQGPDQRAVAGALLLTLAIAVIGFFAALLGDGDYELVKHLYLVDVANFLLIILLVSVVGQLLVGLRKGAPRRPVSTGGPLAWP